MSKQAEKIPILWPHTVDITMDGLTSSSYMTMLDVFGPARTSETGRRDLFGSALRLAPEVFCERVTLKAPIIGKRKKTQALV